MQMSVGVVQTLTGFSNVLNDLRTNLHLGLLINLFSATIGLRIKKRSVPYVVP